MDKYSGKLDLFPFLIEDRNHGAQDIHNSFIHNIAIAILY